MLVTQPFESTGTPVVSSPVVVGSVVEVASGPVVEVVA
jgi:hypothetical protein